ncbi:MAG TPA: glycosyltransferase [Candidatus Acidoferrum sp.]|nr:glycosyltransferase [Candidatus Acidoferrum sp.]
MNQNVPSVTVLIAARPGQAEVKAVDASRALDYPADKLEIIVARGKQPSAQRNAALKAARGELTYFLDDDSLPEAANLRRAIAHFSRPEVKMVGGPNVCPPAAPELEQVFALVLGSWLALGPSRARYTPVGQVRETSEKELILCNLVARRDAMLELGGFNEALYPNEENALMDELQKRGGKLVYDPAFVVHRRPRPNLAAFARMLMTYGRGRAEQFRLHPTPGSALNFVPPLFLVYLVSLVAVPWVGTILLVPLGVYGLAVLTQAAVLRVSSPKSQVPGSHSTVQSPPTSTGQQVFRRVAVIPLICLTHVLYGAGFWRGLFTRLGTGAQPPPPAVVLETVAR